MRAAHCMSLLSYSFAFAPWGHNHGHSPLAGLKCNNLFYPQHELAFGSLFDANFDSPPYGAGGTVGLSGGIETAIDKSLCLRLTGMPASAPRFAAACDDVVRAVQAAAHAWSSRHPALYFNWTADIHDTKKAELVITSSFDSFSSFDMHDTLAYTKVLGDGSRRLFKGTGGARFRAEASRVAVYVNPYRCFVFGAHAVRGCGEWQHKRLVLAVTGLASGVAGALVLIAGWLAARAAAKAARERYEAWQAKRRAWRDTLRLLESLAAELASPPPPLMFVSASEAPLPSPASLGVVEALIEEHRGAPPPAHPPSGEPSARSHVAFSLIGCALLAVAVTVMVLEWRLVNMCTVAAVPISSGKGDSSSKGCYSLAHTLAHELGHTLGMDHPDSNKHGVALMHADGGDANTFVPLNSSRPCESLVAVKQKSCDELGQSFLCSRSRLCAWDRSGHCQGKYVATVMAAHAHNHGTPLNIATGPPVPTEDDLASLFFLYPAPDRVRSWGTEALPLAAYTTHKLRALQEDFFPDSCKESGGGEGGARQVPAAHARAER